MRRRKRLRKKSISSKLFGLVLGVYVLTSTFSVLLGNLNRVNAGIKQNKLRVYVDSVTVREGDTLWSIAKSYYSEYYESTMEYVIAIKECNGLADDMIYPGNHIIIPYTERR